MSSYAQSIFIYGLDTRFTGLFLQSQICIGTPHVDKLRQVQIRLDTPGLRLYSCGLRYVLVLQM